MYFKKPRSLLQREWSENSINICSIRDDILSVQEEEKNIYHSETPERTISVPTKLNKLLLDESTIIQNSSKSKLEQLRPKIAILREQGINGQIEMAAGFTAVGFDAYDIHMTDIISKRVDLSDYSGMAISGGFSYGDVFGAGKGWAKSILLNSFLREEFKKFFNDQTKFVFGVCNGCQFLCELQEILPSNQVWPKFLPNKSNRFEARQSLVEVLDSESIFLKI